ncbi:probable serine/threonine-protein kinase DDB_G0282963 [Tigriopus californicus]|uniref:probable serine/threonine-protein kinase DDB_G0282963 n=1 Tax=Tigriopus californicus TaxID=6832 RepID=UPI0027D9CEFA|nr:probable serine/threonine-protein kinase DDB_G0282963 [Tigriopus californicus]XP_059090296.1 probable serine/threonine-protein kinase DDB_G0282963 [Tigriopus californicus]
MSMLEPESSEVFDDIQHTGILHTREESHDDNINANVDQEAFSSGSLGNHPGETIQMLRNGSSHACSTSPDPSAPLNLHENSEDLVIKGTSSSNPASQQRKYGFLYDSSTHSVATTTRYAESDKLRSMRAKKEQREKRKENKNVKTVFKVEGHDQYDYNRVLEFLGETTKEELKKGKKTQKSGGAVALTATSGNGSVLISTNSSGNGGVKSKASRKKSKDGSDLKTKTYQVNGNAKAHSAGEEEEEDDDDGNDSDNNVGAPGRKVNGVKDNSKKVITKSNSEESSSTSSSRQRDLKEEELIKFDHNNFMVMVNPPDPGDLRRQTSRSIENLSSFTTVTKKKKKKSPTLSSDDGYHNYSGRSLNSTPDYRSNNNYSNNININNNVGPPVGNGGGFMVGTHSRNKFHPNKSQSGHVVINMANSSSSSNNNNNNNNSSSSSSHHSNPLNRDIIKLFRNAAASGNSAPNGVMGTNSHSGSSSQSSSAAVTTTTTTDVSAASSVPQSPPSTDLEFGAADFPPLAENLVGEEESGSDSGPTAIPLNNASSLGGPISNNNNLPLSDNGPSSTSFGTGPPPPAASTWPRKTEASRVVDGTGSSPAHSHSSLTTSDSQMAVIPPKKNSASEAETPPSLCGPPDVTQGISPNLMNALPDVTAQAPYLADSHSGDSTPPRQRQRQAEEVCSQPSHCDEPPRESEHAATASIHNAVYRADSASCGGSSVCEPGRDTSSRNSTASFFLDTDNNVEIVLTEEEYNRRREIGSAPVVILSKSEHAHGDWLGGAPDVEFGFDINQTLLNAPAATASHASANDLSMMTQTLAKLPSGGGMYLGGDYAPMAVIPPTTPISHVDGAIVSFGESIDPVSPQANYYSSVMSIPDGQGMTWAEMVAASSSSSGPGSPEMPPIFPSSRSSHTPIFQATPEDLSPSSSGRATPVIESSVHYASSSTIGGCGAPPLPPPCSNASSSLSLASSSTTSTSSPSTTSSYHLNYLELVTFVASEWQITRDDLKSNRAQVYSASQFLPKSAPSSATPLMKSSSKAALI